MLILNLLKKSQKIYAKKLLIWIANLKPKSDEMAQKTKKHIYKCILEFHFTSISVMGGSILEEKGKIVVPLCIERTEKGWKGGIYRRQWRKYPRRRITDASSLTF
jgi:hypothetical protein